jgi:transposase InsO family protein
LCEALDSTREDTAFTAFERMFRERGLPAAIRSDNGVPFASSNALFNLSKLSVWWLRVGIAIERIKPGHPQQNGRHERMHRADRRSMNVRIKSSQPFPYLRRSPMRPLLLASHDQRLDLDRQLVGMAVGRRERSVSPSTPQLL